MNSPHLSHFTDFVGGQLVAAERSGTAIELIAPQTGQTIGTIAESGSTGVDRAVAAASSAFAANRRQPTHERIAWLNAAAQALGKANDEIAALICEDVGKPIRMARFEVRRGAEFLQLTAAALTQLGGEMRRWILPLRAPGILVLHGMCPTASSKPPTRPNWMTFPPSVMSAPTAYRPCRLGRV